MNTRIRLAVIEIIAIVMVLAGCGDTVTEPEMTKSGLEKLTGGQDCSYSNIPDSVLASFSKAWCAAIDTNEIMYIENNMLKTTKIVWWETLDGQSGYWSAIGDTAGVYHFRGIACILNDTTEILMNQVQNFVQANSDSVILNKILISQNARYMIINFPELKTQEQSYQQTPSKITQYAQLTSYFKDMWISFYVSSNEF